MPPWKRPTGIDGPLAELKDELHLLHEAAGHPSVAAVRQDMKRHHGATSISRATVHKVACEARLPDRATMLAFVRVLVPRTIPPRGEQEEIIRFTRLWEAAGRAQKQQETDPPEVSPPVFPPQGHPPEWSLDRLETELNNALANLSRHRRLVQAAREEAAKAGEELLWRADREAQQIVRQAHSQARELELRTQLEDALRQARAAEAEQEVERLQRECARLQERLQDLDAFREDTAADLMRERAALLRALDGLTTRPVPPSEMEEVPLAEPLPDLEMTAGLYMPSPSPAPDATLAPSGPNPSLA